MKEYKIGEEITLVVKEVQKGVGCPDCFFFNEGEGCLYSDITCFPHFRSDGKNIIFVEKKGGEE